MGKEFVFYVEHNEKVPADLSMNMAWSDLHVKKITLAPGWRMKGGVRIDVKGQQVAIAVIQAEMMAAALPLVVAKAKRKNRENLILF